MAFIEASDLAFSPHRREHDRLICGLIERRAMRRHRVYTPDQEVLDQFDHMSTQANYGIVNFRDRQVRIDDFTEASGNQVRSVVIPVETNDEGYGLFRTVNLISHKNGQTYLEVHPSISCPDGTLWEPDAGSPWVMAGEHSDVVLFYQVAEEATLPQPALSSAA